MGRREKQRKTKLKSDYEEEEVDDANHSFVFNDSDDEEANEDLSLKIVEKARSRAAAIADNGGVAGSSDVVVVANDGGVSTEVVGSKVVKKKIKKEKKKKKKKVVTKAGDEIETITRTKEEETVCTIEEAEVVKTSEKDGVDNSNVDNPILRKLLRGPRYFDPPDKSWGACFNCGEQGHSVANCTSEKRKRPCFICGSLEHEARQCQKGQDCFICKGVGHRAKDCPQKFKRCSQRSDFCLKCGAASHAMSSCNNNYSLDDLKEIQCYVCKRFGHLCCANYSDALPSEASCYKCGHLGHYGQECRGSRGETSAGTPSSCYKCGEEGHFARECASSTKAKKRTRDLSTPSGKRSKDNKGYQGLKSAPHDLGKARKNKKLQFDNGSPNWSSKSKQRGGWSTTEPMQFDNGSPNWSGKSKQRGGWSTTDPGDYPRKSAWRSPATPNKQHKIFGLTHAGHGSSSHSYKKHSPGTSSSQGYGRGGYQQHRYSASRFGYASNDGPRRNYDWW